MPDDVLSHPNKKIKVTAFKIGNSLTFFIVLLALLLARFLPSKSLQKVHHPSLKLSSGKQLRRPIGVHQTTASTVRHLRTSSGV
ncbi:MAG TPA: hypothetical protein DDW52_23195 [Planctomycetaceae bacterium]|nr:hypothetical protein [Planctomycetaceae bacterium]